MKKRKFKFNKIKNLLDSEMVRSIEENGNDLEVLRTGWSDTEIETKSLEDGSRTVIKYVSTRSVDQIGDVVVPKGVILKQFIKSGMPVFWSHNYSLPQIGKDEWVKSDDWGIKVKQKYADLPEGTLADILWKLTKQGMNTQSSVGIIPLEVIREDDDGFKPAIKALSKEWPEFSKNAKSVKRLITKSLLFEHSDCGIGCNNDTEVLAVSKAFIDSGADEALLKKLGLPLLQPIIEGEDGEDKELDLYNFGGSIETIDKAKVEEECELAWKEYEIELTKAAPEKVEEVFEIQKVYEKVELIEKAPEKVELVQKAIFNREEIKKIISDEVRRKMGRLI